MPGFGFDQVYLARHGQTTWNVEGRRQGRLDSPLTAQGRLQAQRNAELLSTEPIDAIYSSPLGRARSTAAIFAAKLRLPVQLLAELSEVDHGDWSGLTTAEIDAGWPGGRTARKQDKYRFRFPGGESYADAEARTARALTTIARAGVRRPLVVSHEMVGRMLVKQLARLSPEEALRRDHPSDVLYRVDATGRVGPLTSRIPF